MEEIGKKRRNEIKKLKKNFEKKNEAKEKETKTKTSLMKKTQILDLFIITLIKLI